MNPVPAVIANLPGDPSIKRILVMRWSAMGDVAIASAAMQDIREAFPNGQLDLNTLPPWDSLFAHDPRFSRVLSVKLRGPGAGIAGIWRWLKEVAQARYDLIIDLQSNDRARLLMLLLWLSGRAPRYRVSNHRRFPYNIAPAAVAQPIHALDHMRASLAAAGIPPRATTPVLYPGKDHRRRAAELLENHGVSPGSYAVMLPGCQAAGYLKRWGALRFSALAIALRGRGIEHVLLLGAEDEAEECRSISIACGDWVINCCGQTRPLDIVPLCEQARLVVANDTGTAHVAAAAGRPMVVICGPTDPRKVKPVGPAVVALQAPLFCVNCYRKHCSHHSCMLLVTPDEVIESLEALGALSAR